MRVHAIVVSSGDMVEQGIGRPMALLWLSQGGSIRAVPFSAAAARLLLLPHDASSAVAHIEVQDGQGRFASGENASGGLPGSDPWRELTESCAQ